MAQQPPSNIEEFTVAYKALVDTEWIDNPANPTDHLKGFIGQGERIWLHPDHSGIGPLWQQARLVDKTLRYIHFHDFKKQ
ncbi:hypothetical protein [Spirosoma endbachense]|uniref:Uncharacterized protein n=1 Tax=Spirosoma endbachense TaxID=2666025 RepID=A0A6P1W314_9BACT|nr:hypothetical protein [Spirosoma endbachense]QHV98692.1 hypothetical protein GJR95_28425 [Spirosoma endbachense]